MCSKIRLFNRVLAAAALFGALAAAAPAAVALEQIKLRSPIVVDGDQITIGDLVENAGDKADVLVAAAPAPGEKSVYRASSVARLLRKYGFDWSDARRTKRIVIKRASQIVPREDLMTELTDRLMEFADGQLLEVQLNSPNLKIHVATDADTSFSIEDVTLNRRTGQFAATVFAPAGDPSARQIVVKGRTHRVVEVPVLANAMAPGAVLEPADIAYRRYRLRSVSRNIITDSNLLVGQALRRSMPADRPLRTSDVEAPVAVAKGDMVNMTYQIGGLLLTASGRALKSGGVGEKISVVNAQSHRTIEARIVGNGQVVVLTRVATNFAANQN